MSLILIIVGIFLVAAAAAVVVVLTHHKLAPAVKTPPPMPSVTTIAVPTAAELQDKLRLAYESQIELASTQFGADLKATSIKLSEQVERLTSNVIEQELNAYEATLAEVRKVATQTMEQIHDAVEGQRVQLRIGLEEEMATERQRLVDQFDARIGDVISSYVAESLGSGVDLGAQLQYITRALEDNKATIRKDLLGEA